MEWGDIIRRIRQDKGLTQENVAEELGVDKTTIIRWEQSGKIKADQLEKLAKVFGIELAQLYAYHTEPSLLEDPLAYYKAKTKVSITIELDGSMDTLNQWFATLKKLNAALA